MRKPSTVWFGVTGATADQVAALLVAEVERARKALHEEIQTSMALRVELERVRKERDTVHAAAMAAGTQVPPATAPQHPAEATVNDPGPGWRWLDDDEPRSVGEYRRRVEAKGTHPAPVPPAPESRPAETRKTQAERVQSQAEPWKWWNPLPSSCGALHPTPDTQPAPVPPADGLRTERVTLSERTPGEAAAYAQGMAATVVTDLIRERDAALRERDAARADVAGLRSRLDAEAAPGLRSLANNLRDKLRSCESALKRVEGERDAAKEECERRLTMCDSMKRERDAAQFNVSCLTARVAELERDRRPATWQEEEAAVEGAWLLCGLEPDWPNDEPGTIVRHAESMRREIGRLRDCVAELESATAANAGGEAKQEQPPRGWLTSEDHRAVAFAAKAMRGHAITGNLKEIADQLDALLARSTPPRVKVPSIPPEFNLPAWNLCMARWIAAIREAGGEVEE